MTTCRAAPLRVDVVLKRNHEHDRNGSAAMRDLHRMVAHQQDDVFAHGARFGTDRENGCEEECVGTSDASGSSPSAEIATKTNKCRKLNDRWVKNLL